MQVIDPDTAALLGVTAPTNAPDPLACLDAITSEPATKSGKLYPVLPDPDGTAASLARRSIELAEAEDQRKACNKLLGELVVPFFFRHWAGRADFESSVKVNSPAGPVLVTCQKRVTKMETADQVSKVAHILNGKEKDLFYHTFDLSIDGDQIPPAKVAPLVTELAQLFSKYGCGKALSKKRSYRPYPGFYSQRMVLFTPEQNEEINRAVPIVAAVKTKGIK